MIKEDIPLYKLDLTGTDKYNRVDHEYGYRREVKNNNIVIPPKAPFYQKSFKMYGKDGQPLTEGKDWEFYGIMGKLTKFTGKPVGLFVRLLDDNLTEWYWDYQVVGNFNKITNEILNMLHSIYEDDRFVHWDNIENKPLWFIPEIHQHDLAYDIFGFTDLAKELNRIADITSALKTADTVVIKQMQDNLAYYIEGYKKVLKDLIDSHDANKYDAHGVDKGAIGLGNVDNYLTATLEETLEGLRDDLHITPYNAARAAEAAAGRNERLFPSGSLPLLRYGSDTFIPPTISGSFEGLGGMQRRVGGLVETDGTMLILQHRNNGKFRGLYFVRCKDWKSQTPDYEFTSYRYQHPTATADGAVLDTIINGSNRYIMVVGDVTKNIWYYAETNGTFNPDQHILRRISGPWVTEDMSTWSDSWYTDLDSKCTVLADENYAEGWSLLQSYQITVFGTRRTLPNPPNWYWERALNLDNAGYSIFYFRNLSPVSVRCKIDYTHEVFGNYNDNYFTPWWPEAVDDGTGGRGANLLSMFARYKKPAKYLWAHRSIHGAWLRSGPNEFNIRFSTTGIEPGPTYRRAFFPTFKGTLKFEAVGAGVTCHITPHPDMKLMTIDTDVDSLDDPNYREYMERVNTFGTPDGADRIGSFVVDSETMHYSDGFGNSTFPSVYCGSVVPWLKDKDAMLTRFPYSSTQKLYKKGDGRLIFNEANPLGMTEMFVLQRWMSADTTRWDQTGFLIKQPIPSGSEWVFRHSQFAKPDWSHSKQSQATSFNGKTFIHHPLISNVRKVDLGQQVRFNQMLPLPNGSTGNANYRYLFGADSMTTVYGRKPDKVNPNRSYADFRLPLETQTSIVDGIVKFKHISVLNVKRMVEQDLLAVFATVGCDLRDVQDTWTISRVQKTDGSFLWVAMVSKPRGSVMSTYVVLGNIVLQGGTTPENDYTLYQDARWESTSSVVGVTTDFNVQFPGIWSYWDLNTIDSAKLNHGLCINIPFSNRAPDGTVAGADTSTVYLRSTYGYQNGGGDIMTAVILEFNAAGTQILNLAPYDSGMWTMQTSIEPMPYDGVIRTAGAIMVFEGAAIAGPTVRADRVYDGMATWAWADPGGILGATNIITPAYTIYFNEINNVLLAGKMYDIPSTYIDLMVQDPNPANKRYYVYLTYSGGNATYVASTEIKPETPSQSMIAIVTCGPTQIDNILPFNRFSMDGASISINRQGSSILASSGSVYEIGNTSNILLDGDFVP